MGRPKKLNKDVIRDALTASQMGMSIELLSDYIGVARSTVFEWIRRGSEEPGTIYREFSDAVSRGRSQCAALNLHRIQQASAEDWRAAAWIMERRFGYHRQLDVRAEYKEADRRPIQTGADLDELLSTLGRAEEIRGQLSSLVVHEDEE
jgi:transposase